MQLGGGIMTREDLGRYSAVWRDPIVFEYRDHMVVSMPPPSSGGVALAEMLNILEGYNLQEFGFLSREHAHVWAEAAKRAFADRNTYLADPDFVPPACGDADLGCVRNRTPCGNRYRSSNAIRTGAPPACRLIQQLRHNVRAQTRHIIAILDGDGNAVAVTTTINSLYGSLVTVAGAGFLLNNEMDDFAARPGTPNQFGLVQGSRNAVEPEKRMFSSMSPTVLLDATGRVKLVTGSPGGPTIISSIAQMISNIVDFNMDIGSATAAPRLHHQHVPDLLYYEHNGLARDVESACCAP